MLWTVQKDSREHQGGKIRIKSEIELTGVLQYMCHVAERNLDRFVESTAESRP